MQLWLRAELAKKADKDSAALKGLGESELGLLRFLLAQRLARK
jgi:hypothetical protein